MVALIVQGRRNNCPVVIDMTAELLDQILERLRGVDPGKWQGIAREVERATADM